MEKKSTNFLMVKYQLIQNIIYYVLRLDQCVIALPVSPHEYFPVLHIFAY